MSTEDAAVCKTNLKFSHIYNTALLAARYLKERVPIDSKILCLGTDGMLEQFRQEGFTGVFTLPSVTARMTDADFCNFKVDNEICAIVKGPYQDFDMRKLSIVSATLREKPDIHFVATNADLVFVSGSSGRLMPDVGATLHLIEKASERRAVCMGKPERACFDTILEEHFSNQRTEWSN